MTARPFTPDALVDESCYEIAGVCGNTWLAVGWLTPAELEAFQTVLAGVCSPLAGRLDDGANDWINQLV